MSWLLFAILYPLCYSAVNLIDRFLLEKKVKNFYSYGVLAGFLLFLSALIVLSIAGIGAVETSIIFWAVFSGVLYGIVYLMYYHLLSRVEVSRVIGIGYLFPVFVAILSRIFLGESLSIFKYFAIMLAVTGAIFIGMEKSRHKLKLTSAFWVMVFYAFLLGVVDTTDKYVLGYLSFFEAYALITIPVSLIMMAPMIRSDVRRDLKQAARSFPGILLSMCFTVLASFSFLVAASLAPISMVSAMGALQPLVVFIFMLAMSFFMPSLMKESTKPSIIGYKILGILCVITGVIILSI